MFSLYSPYLHQVRVGSSLVLTCRALAPNLELVKDLQWLDPRGRHVTEDGRIYSEVSDVPSGETRYRRWQDLLRGSLVFMAHGVFALLGV